MEIVKCPQLSRPRIAKIEVEKSVLASPTAVTVASALHWFDGLVGSAVAASIQGAVLLGQVGPSRAKRKPIKLSELQKKLAS